MNELDSTEYIGKIISKLDISYEDKWSTLAENTRRNRGREANFDDLVKFIDFQSSRANDPAYSREAIKGLKVNASIFRPTNGEGKGCHFCRCSDHDSEECPVYLNKDVKNRQKMIFEKRLCFTCLCPIYANHKGRLVRFVKILMQPVFTKTKRMHRQRDNRKARTWTQL